MPELRVNGIIEESIVDGPGLRFVVFTQGCPHHCKGCHNPETHDPAGGYTLGTDVIFEQFRLNPLLSGITFSGGEPFMQAGPLAELACKVKTLGKSVVVFSGFVFEQLVERIAAGKAIGDLLAQTDMLIDGPYVESLRDLELQYRGSTNQRVLNRDAMHAIEARMRTAAGYCWQGFGHDPDVVI